MKMRVSVRACILLPLAASDVLQPLIDVELSIVPHLARSYFRFCNVLHNLLSGMISSFQQEIKFPCQATNCFLKSLSVVCLLIAKFFNNLIFLGKTNFKDIFYS